MPPTGETFKGTNAALKGKVFTLGTNQASQYDETYKSLLVYIADKFDRRVHTAIKGKDEETGKTRYDFRYKDKDGYFVTIEGLSRSFDPEFWNYARLISGVLRHGMPIADVVNMVENLHLSDDTLNTWKNGVIRALKQYVPAGTAAEGVECSECGQESLVYEEGCLSCKNCGHSKCG